MHAVVTTALLKPGSIDTVVALFEETNPDLVRDQPHWRGARMLVDPEADRVQVIAYWDDPLAYAEMAAGERFKSTMARFGEHFAAPPEVRVMNVALEMTPESVARG